MTMSKLARLLFLIASFKLIESFEIDLTPEIPAGTEQCFFQPVKKVSTMDVEYQVLDGGDLDISFYIHAPNGQMLISDVQKSDAAHKVDLSTVGDYKICFDNTYSHFADKIVYFEVSSDDNDEEDETDWNVAREELSGLIDMTIEDFKKMIGNMKDNLDKSEQTQHILKNYEARDRNIAESNFLRVNWFSGIQLFLMISVGLTQVLLIRNLFDDKSRVSQVMKART